MKKIYAILLFIAAGIFYANAQIMATDLTDPTTEKLNLGVGIGFDYGTIGANLLFYTQKNIGIFAGGGYNLMGFSYNAGLKGRFFVNETAAVVPFVTAMYGNNSTVIVKNMTNLNKAFYGPTFGAGVDWYVGGGIMKYYLSIALNVPVRGDEPEEYRTYLKNNHGVEFQNEFLPIGVSVGYRFRLK